MPDNHPVHYSTVTRRERVISMIIAAVVLLIVMLCCGIVIRRVFATPTALYYSDSLRMDGTYDATHAFFSWTPSMLPGYQIDFGLYPDCPGEIRVGNIARECVSLAYYEPGNSSYYFVAYLDPTKICGKSGIELQPFLAVYNPISGAHDVIYGLTEIVDLSDCKFITLPIIVK